MGAKRPYAQEYARRVPTCRAFNLLLRDVAPPEAGAFRAQVPTFLAGGTREGDDTSHPRGTPRPPLTLVSSVATMTYRRRASMERAIGYARVSTEEQASEGVSLPAQEGKIRAYCALHGFALVRVIAEEGVSGTIPLAERPGGAELIRALRTREVRHIVALKLDRLFRDAMDCLAWVKEWDRAGVTLHLIDQGGQALNTRSAVGRFFLTIMAGVAEMERNMIAERTRLALAYKRAQRQVYGQIPYGYRREGNTLVPVPEELEVIALIRKLREAGLSYTAIARELQARGIPTKTGRRWHHQTIRRILDRAEEVLAHA